MIFCFIDHRVHYNFKSNFFQQTDRSSDAIRIKIFIHCEIIYPIFYLFLIFKIYYNIFTISTINITFNN